MAILALKIDVDTDRGTREGLMPTVDFLKSLNVPATFLFSLGPDKTGLAIKRALRPGFLKKVSRTSVVEVYGLRTLLSGTLLPAPHIAKRNGDVMRKVRDAGFEIGIHSWIHEVWNQSLKTMSKKTVYEHINKARDAFEDVFGFAAKTAGTAAWQANAYSLQAYDDADFLYGSDCRGTEPFFPHIDGKTYNTLQIPTTMQTLDELLGDPDFSKEKFNSHFLDNLSEDHPNVFTIHSELEGMAYFDWFKGFVKEALERDIEFQTTEQIANNYLANREQIPICEFIQDSVENRSGTLAMQGKIISYSQK